METTDRRLRRFLFAIEGVGGAFVALFLVAYLAGIPTTVVYHSEVILRYPLFALGIVLLMLILAAVLVAARKR